MSKKEYTLIRPITKRCGTKPCPFDATYGVKGTDIPLYCRNHKERDHINLVYALCTECDNIALKKYNGRCILQNITTGKNSYIPLLDPAIVNTKCPMDNCLYFPKYGKPGSNGPLYCEAHKQDGFVPMLYKLCDYQKCHHFGKKAYNGKCDEQAEVRPVYNKLHDMMEWWVASIINNAILEYDVDTIPLKLNEFLLAYNPEAKYGEYTGVTGNLREKLIKYLTQVKEDKMNQDVEEK